MYAWKGKHPNVRSVVIAATQAADPTAIHSDLAMIEAEIDELVWSISGD